MSFRSISRILALSAIAALGTVLPFAKAAVITWDRTDNSPSGGIQNAGGTWSTTQKFWTTDNNLTPLRAWDNIADADNTAQFGAGSDAVGTITLAEPINAGGLTFLKTGYTIAGSTLTLAAGSVIDTSTLGTKSTTTISSILAGSGGITIKSCGDLSDSGGGAAGLGVKLSGANTFTGDVTVTSGFVTYDSNFGNAANKIVLNGGGLVYNASGNINRNIEIGPDGGVVRLYGGLNSTWSGALTGTGKLRHTDGGTLTLAGDLSNFHGSLENLRTYVILNGSSPAPVDAKFITSSWYIQAYPGQLANATVVMNGGQVTWMGTNNTDDISTHLQWNDGKDALFGTNGNNVTFATPLSMVTSGVLYKYDTGKLTLTGKSNYSGGTEIIGGTLEISTVDSLGTGYLGIKACLRYTGTGAEVWNPGVTQPIWCDESAYSIDIANAGANLVLNASGGNNNHDFTKIGPGTLTWGTNCNLTGSVNLNEGTVVFASNSSASGAITLNPGAAILVNGGSITNSAGVSVPSGSTVGGNGTIVGPVSLAWGATLQGGYNDNMTGLKLSSLSFSDSANINLMPSRTDVTGIVVSTPAGLTTYGYETINIVNGAPVGPGTYNLIGYSGGVSGMGLASFVLGSTPSDAGYRSRSYALDTQTDGLVKLVVSGDAPVWSGKTDANWDTATVNWKLASDHATDTTFYARGDAVIFDDSATGTTDVKIKGADVYPASVTFNNNTLNYTISGANGIAGNTGLLKQGTGTVTIATVNSFTGSTTISGGKLVIGADNALGAAPQAALPQSIVINGGTLSANTSFTLSASRGIALGSSDSTPGSGTIDVVDGAELVYAGVLANNGAGIGSLVKTGKGSLNLAGMNTFTGDFSVNEGTLELSAVGNGTPVLRAASLTLQPGTTLRSTAANPLGWSGNRVRTLTLNGATYDSNGFEQHFWGTTVNMTGSRVILGDANLQCGGSGDGFTPSFNIYKSDDTSTIEGDGYLRLREGQTDLNFYVERGSQPVDFRVCSLIDPRGGGDHSVVKNGDGVMELAGNLDNDAVKAIVNGGTLILNKPSTPDLHAIGADHVVGLTINAGATVQLAGAGGDQIFTGTGVVNEGTFDLNGRSEGFWSITGTGTITNSAHGTTGALTLGEYYNDDFMFSGAIQDGNGVVALTKTGTGILVLAGPLAYSGPTKIDGGTLAIENGLNNVLTDITGPSGTLIVGSGTSLTARSIDVDTLIIGGSTSSAVNGNAVPEPSTLILLIVGALILAGTAIRRNATSQG